MLRIAVSVEGATEREFISQVLAPYFLENEKYLQAIDIRGNVSLDKIKNDLFGLLYGFDYTTTLYDYYGFKKRGNRSINELEKAIKMLAPPEKQDYFIPYIQKYEFEALLFSDPKRTAIYFGDVEQAEKLNLITHECGGAEEINNGFDTCPNRRISDLFPTFNKKLDAPEICKAIGLSTIRNACPRFNHWITQLESLT